MKIHRRTDDEAQTEALAEQFARCLRGGELIALSGELGAGKTCFARGLVRGLGGEARSVSSPTFVLCREYAVGQNLSLAHIDAYRISGGEELESIGWSELIDSDDVIIALEWPDRLRDTDLPTERLIRIEISVIERHARVFRIAVPEALAYRFEELRASVRLCPICARTVESEGQHFPFCSDRCRLVDLGEWFNETYQISRPVQSDDLTD